MAVTDREQPMGKRGGAAEEAEQQQDLLQCFLGTFRHYFGTFAEWVRGVDDPRPPSSTTYSLASLVFAGLLLFVCHLGSRRQFNARVRGNGASRAKFGTLFGVEQVPHGDTLHGAFKRLDPGQVQEVVCQMVETLLRRKVLYPYRLLDRYFLVAIDGTGQLTFRTRHCPHCLTRTLKDGTILYYHPVIEAKLVTATGLALSVMTEFIENPDPHVSTQDCELKAFYRLAERLKQRFPRLPLCLLLDGLYAGGPTFALCARYGWQYLITLKDRDLPTVNEEFEALSTFEPGQALQFVTGRHQDIHQAYRWVNDIAYVDSEQREHPVSVLECRETKPDPTGTRHTTKFKWVTSFRLTAPKVIPLANEGGRVRWKIENEGFNSQKNGGFEAEHAYSEDETARKIFYFVLQMAHLLFQLLAKGSLLRQVFPQGMGALKNLAFYLLEAWRNVRLPPETVRALSPHRFQIRFNTS